MSASALVICEHCDALYQRRPLHGRETARCQRCSAPLYRARGANLQVLLALTVTGLLTLIVANLYPIVTVQVGSTVREATLWGAVFAAYDMGVGFVALLSALTVFFFPLMQLLLYLHVLLPMALGERGIGFRYAMHVLRRMQPWAMVEVFMLGTLVAVVKLAGMAEVHAQAGIWAFALLTVLLTLINSTDLHEVWDLADDLCQAPARDARA